MALHITVKHKDGSEIRTRISAATEVAFERNFKKSWTSAFSEAEPFNEYIYYAAWHSQTVDKKTPFHFEDWLLTFDSYSVEADDANPTSPAALPG
jgi:hypothetical protein